MRLVVVHLRVARKSEAADYLARTYRFQQGPPWIADVAGDPVLYIEFGPVSLYPSPVEHDEFVSRLGWEPSASVQAGVSGRHDGDEQVRAFVCGLLGAFEGVAQDEYTDHCWSREQILACECVQGHPFFDCQGWYESLYGG